MNGFVGISRNDRVEAMITVAIEKQEYAPFHRMLEALSRPSQNQPDATDQPALSHERVAAIFCGT